jgi:hypothetical protein
MRSHGISAGLAAVLLVLAIAGCGGGSSSNATGNGAPVNSSAIRKQLEQAITSSASVKPAQANKIVDCILAKMSAAGIKTNGQAESQQTKVGQFSETCTEQVLTAAGGQ